MINKKRKLLGQSGFTIIEILVVFSVIAILSSIGIAASVNYSRAQSLDTAYQELLTVLNQAKSYSQSQYKASACGSQPLEKYRVELELSQIDSDYYDLVVICGGNPYQISRTYLPKDVELDTATAQGFTFSEYFEFPILTGGIQGEMGSLPPWQINILGIGGRSKIISVYSDGNIK